MFTQKFLTPGFEKEFQVSRPRGLGLDLESLVGKRDIVIMAGGTGFYPFSDLIDILFKELLVMEGHHMKGEIIKRDPLTQNVY